MIETKKEVIQYINTFIPYRVLPYDVPGYPDVYTQNFNPYPYPTFVPPPYTVFPMPVKRNELNQ